MKAGLVTGERRFELVEVPEPRPLPGLVVAEVLFCGICGTDVHGFISSELSNPATCGHEWVGTVAAVGPEVQGLTEGDRVVAGIAPPCGQCAECLAGRPAYCIPAYLGMTGRDALAPPHGAFAPRIAVGARRMVPVARDLTDVQAAVVEPTTVALHAVNRTLPLSGETVVVQGCGPIGLLVLQCVVAAGAEHVVAVEPDDARRALALTLGAAEALTPEEARAELGSNPAELVFECAGAPAAVQAAVDLVRRGGRVNLVGVTRSATIEPSVWTKKEVAVVGSLGYLREEFAQTMDLIADGLVRIEPLHDATVPLAGAARAITELADDPSSAVKVLVNPRD